ncbi:MAG: DUF3572 domain-containing protein [Rubricella sp.]
MQTRDAIALAQSALLFIIVDEDRLMPFLAQTGADLSQLRVQAGEPEFLAFVLDYLLQSESVLTAFCEAESLPYDRPLAARAALPGGADPHWT